MISSKIKTPARVVRTEALGGGDGGNRTRVRKSVRTGVSERRHIFTFPYAAVKCRTAVLGSPLSVIKAEALLYSRSPLK